jgi:hypothetical protein
LTEYSRNCVSFDAAARYDNALLIVLAAVDVDATVNWDVAPSSWAKQIEQGRVLVIFCSPYRIDIPL